ncbi:RibD family protein [Micrococcoides hystricis]|uniref:RibD family protein n=1 Tax=Micrococcoides hystricis TaxID=1572761 RepID=A0ABV6PBH3_9MICC
MSGQEPRDTAVINPNSSAGLSEPVWESLRNGSVPELALPTSDGPLIEWYRPLVEAGERLVIAQLGQSMDGFIASRTGDACFVTGEEDRTHLHRLRAIVDAVVVGAQTVSADDCQLTVRAVSGENPTRVILDPKARVPETSNLLTDGAAPTLWIVTEEAEIPSTLADHVEVVRVASAAELTPAKILQILAERGLTRVLIEGGGVTVSDFVQAQVLDRLMVTSAPVLIGDGVPGLRFSGTDKLSEALSAPTRRMGFGQDVCTDFDFSATR